MRKVTQLKSLQGKRVLVRVGFDVPLGDKNGVDLEEAFRLKAALPTLKFLLGQKARVIIIAHRGRPEGPDARFSLKPIADCLDKLLVNPVYFVPVFDWLAIQRRVQNLKEGEVLFLENIRFLKGEQEKDLALAQQLAQLADLYVNEAFSVAHRDHASISGVPQYLPAYAGIHLAKEVETLSNVFEHPRRPLTFILGGIKMGAKVEVLGRFWQKADHFCLGGVLANTILQLQGIAIGASVVEMGVAETLRSLALTDPRLHLPVDARVARDLNHQEGVRIAAIGRLQPGEIILDIGPDTSELFQKIIQESATVVWNGPMGKFEIKEFAQGTLELAHALAESDAFSIVGGGDTVTAVSRAGLLEHFDFVSTGGGAMLEFLAGKPLPGLEALQTSAQA